VTLNGIVALLWVLFLGTWLVLARFTKRRARSGAGPGAVLVRLILAALLVTFLAFERRGQDHGLRLYLARSLVPQLSVRVLGLALCLLGFALAVWARLVLARNWGPPMSLRAGHELVMSGPYARVRHPIYSGLLLAALGSAFAQSALWLALFVLMFAYFVYSARVEERLMCELFPSAYPPYRRRTHMLIPFVL
jgi:protein-S-isoprenylcysteine O-methyltransferase Ste14